MRFRLTYEGELFSRQKKEGLANHKQEIRKSFHPQLKQLWKTHPFLSTCKVYLGYENIADRPADVHVGSRLAGNEDEYYVLKDSVAKYFKKDNFRFVPLVCEKFHVSCSLDVLFLRPGLPSRTVHKGDLDNRMKTLIDALRMPRNRDELGTFGCPDKDEEPLYCLFEDDKYITSLTVESDTLWSPKGDSKNYAQLVIGVNIQPAYATLFNLGFY